ncbi:SAM-dependent methyltransferase [Ignavibacterium album JCM 16511]|uniref:SAM-dependent methyltransferase n=1 Tax=Ignavibacterium album (strain DSM 19864 / JCM 16511 / NBRC 101810 / Mat9-16) TaxID=945713 RepID=I0ANW4_IGNAJ|nr:23S rRNA (uracil(1939)-C(5))-methyltransferase RlmD [Ignavibacterium album]AFH50671.1 SAM-dependent methyltransferase [Ignavibacterium album JCM 16511]
MKIKKGDIAEFKIEKYAFEGKGIAKVSKNDLLGINEPDGFEKNYIVFVHGSYPGDVVKARLTKIKKSYAEAITTEIISASPDRVKAKCKYFGVCGGCKQQDLSYQKQIDYKQKQVEEIFYKLGGFKDFEIENILPSDEIYFYRNKMEFSFSDKRWLTKQEISSATKFQKDFALGLHIPKIFDKVLDVDECFLQSELSNSILNFTRKFFIKKNVSVYSTKTHTGFLRNLVIRQSYYTKDLMVNLVTSEEDDELLKNYSENLIEYFPAVTTIVNNISKKLSAVAVGDYEKVFFGTGFIYDKIGEYTFRISANSFFQTNTRQAEKLYQTALEYADLKGNEVVYDLYSGAGTIAIYISQKAKEVFAFESVQSAVEDAKVNAELNNISNVEFITTDLYKSFLPIIHKKNFPVPEVMIIDPPRSGMHQNTVEDVIQLSPKRIVYVSCNPATQVRDIKMFVDAGYKLLKIRPVDMFPQTYHIENVALLSK